MLEHWCVGIIISFQQSMDLKIIFHPHNLFYVYKVWNLKCTHSGCKYHLIIMHVCENIAYPELITCHVELWVLSRHPIEGFLPWIQKQQNFFSNSHVSLSVLLLCTNLVKVTNTEWTSYKYINNSSSKITAYLLLHSFNHILNNTLLCNSLVYYFPTVLHNHLQNLSYQRE